MRNPFRYFNSFPEVIRLVVMMYIRYPLSLPEGRLTGSDYLLKMPVVLTVSIIAGLIAGLCVPKTSSAFV
jgi:hypothetical protein